MCCCNAFKPNSRIKKLKTNRNYFIRKNMHANVHLAHIKSIWCPGVICLILLVYVIYYFVDSYAVFHSASDVRYFHLIFPTPTVINNIA